jgi:iron complex outermembrane receptor protein
MRSGGEILKSVRLTALAAAILAPAQSALAQSAEDLRHMSISDLADIDVTSVSKTDQALSGAPAAIYVITHDDIVRSGAVTIPEMLRLAPNLQVAQTGVSQYVITARGFSGSSQAQSFSNKLLVLIDGRGAYSPLYSGVYWDTLQVPAADIDRIEVISGPGATLWGANAVNGVINIITRSSKDTQGGLVDVSAGDRQQSVNLRHGGAAGPDLTYRVYALGLFDRDGTGALGAKAHDNAATPQAGFRLDWAAGGDDSVTVQGDGYRGFEAQPGAANEDVSGFNVLGRWSHHWGGGANLQVQAYFDRSSRGSDGAGNFIVNTYDLDVQHSFTIGDREAVVIGGGLRDSQYRIDGTPTFLFTPAGRDLRLFDAFAQDTLSITDRIDLILGLKIENDPYSGMAPLPDVRLSWRPTASTMVWAAASRAIRSPTPFDSDVIEKIGKIVYLIGDPDFAPETLVAYETGARLQADSRLSFSISGYYNVYDDLRSIEPSQPAFIPLAWGNGMRGDT